ncbi:MAG: hypothetical protein J3K34DRAFT_230571 [Monoraphidium minutum]|nr:MAG: hypothetical protein J3K34DRAFT_230571 [Monoraphidium minutum]
MIERLLVSTDSVLFSSSSLEAVDSVILHRAPQRHAASHPPESRRGGGARRARPPPPYARFSQPLLPLLFALSVQCNTRPTCAATRRWAPRRAPTGRQRRAPQGAGRSGHGSWLQRAVPAGVGRAGRRGACSAPAWAPVGAGGCRPRAWRRWRGRALPRARARALQRGTTQGWVSAVAAGPVYESSESPRDMRHSRF